VTAEEALQPTLFVIFGITGDLSQRYLLPALYHLFKEDKLHPETEIIGITRRDVTAEELFEQVELCVNEVDKVCDPVVLKTMHDHTRMMQMDLGKTEDYTRLLQTLNAIEDEKGLCMNRLYYLSIPPQVYQPIITQLGAAGLNTSCQHGTAATRLLVEKPFGYDLISAQDLIAETAKVFGEEQVFRIDHFLAKDTAQDILKFRFENPGLASLWNGDHVESVEIAASEQIGIERRVNFYEPLGALRDFIQNHLLQLLAVTLMDQPSTMTSDAIHEARQALLDGLQPVPADQVGQRTIRGQYAGYREEVSNPDSMTETYADVTLFSSNQRWHDVAFRLWTGKKLSEKKSEVVINFKPSGSLLLSIQPTAKIELSGDPATFPEALRDAVSQYRPPSNVRNNAYERVLMDAVKGDRTLFATSDEVLASWRVLQPVLDEWAKNSSDIITYRPGSQGPLSAASQP